MSSGLTLTSVTEQAKCRGAPLTCHLRRSRLVPGRCCGRRYVGLLRPARSRRRAVNGGGVRLILPERAVRGRLSSAIGKNHRKIGNNQCADHRDRGEPAEVVDEHQDCGDEADRPDTHHDQVSLLTVGDVLRQPWPSFGDEVSLLVTRSLRAFHTSTLFRCQPLRQPGCSAAPRAPSGRTGRTGLVSGS